MDEISSDEISSDEISSDETVDEISSDEISPDGTVDEISRMKKVDELSRCLLGRRQWRQPRNCVPRGPGSVSTTSGGSRPCSSEIVVCESSCSFCTARPHSAGRSTTMTTRPAQPGQRETPSPSIIIKTHHAGVFNCGWRWGLRVEALRAQLAHPLYLVAIDVTDLSDKSLVGIRAGTVMKLVWFCSESVLKRF